MIGPGCGKMTARQAGSAAHCHSFNLEPVLVEEQGTDLIDLRRLLEGVIFGIDPFGGFGSSLGSQI